MPDPEEPVAILIPVFNDWPAVRALLPVLDAALARASVRARAVLVDDGSDLDGGASPGALPALAALARVEVLRLRCNLGHQRAIAVGLGALAARPPGEVVVVMDGDGEDRPEDVPALLAAARLAQGRAVVFARRARRTESLLFRACYLAYRALMSVLAGQDIRIGNFSAVPVALLPRVVGIGDLWNQYAASVVRHRVRTATLPIDRGVRIAGRPKMNLTALVVHGLGAIAVFADVIGARLLIAGAAAGVAVAALWVLLALLGTISPRLAPPWAFTGLALAALAALQVLAVAFVTAIAALQGRRLRGFLPARDYADYVARVDVLAPGAG